MGDLKPVELNELLKEQWGPYHGGRCYTLSKGDQCTCHLCLIDKLTALALYATHKSPPLERDDGSDEILRLEHLKRVHLEPGDFLVLETPRALSDDHVKHLGDLMKKNFGEGQKLIVLEEGMKLGVVSPQEKVVEKVVDAARDLWIALSAIGDKDIQNEKLAELQTALSELDEQKRGE